MNLQHHHVGLSVSDLDSAKRWYANVLGMTQGFAFELAQFGVRGCFMEGHGTRVELFERAGSGGGIGGQDPPCALLTRGYGHVAFATADLDATFAELVRRGATPVWDPRQSPEPGVRMAFVADLDGNLVEFIETEFVETVFGEAVFGETVFGEGR
jgi:catechol 2,3-dioxygenase-like lactoylglutathione lyase family enzyme